MGESKKKLSPKCPQRYLCPLEEKVRIYTSAITSENKKVRIDIFRLNDYSKVGQLICVISQIPWAGHGIRKGSTPANSLHWIMGSAPRGGKNKPCLGGLYFLKEKPTKPDPPGHLLQVRLVNSSPWLTWKQNIPPQRAEFFLLKDIPTRHHICKAI